MASLLFDCLFLSGLTKKEERLLFSLLDWKEISVQEWTEAGRFPESNSGQIVVRKTIEVDSLQTAIDWSKQPLLIGRIESFLLKKLFQQGLNYFLDLQTSQIVDIPLENVPQKKGLNSIVIGPDSLLFQRIRAHLKALGWETIPCRELSALKEIFKEYEPGLFFVDWERLNVRDTVDRLKNLPQRGIFPFVIGIRDVERENLFQDLSIGIRDYCQDLYSEKEIFEILNHSIPALEGESYGSEKFKRLVFKFRTGIQSAEIRVEKAASTQLSDSHLEKIKQRKILGWMSEFL
ncbi:hypothetical protein IQB76_09645 [Leptospira borgpetersenii serovar Hardjo-bovis]|uniref:hypothetical protein n=1 Tax=Leptospira borgpetersenii TaxID=174 RepID=UPI0000E576E7|nr:hypothetical protein [Leptospira borgpetersenii]ABJ78185.1 Hypothetical protein LBL_0601 [Leptospira borgpetersenii serovar Hardjo-bovis str. L550]AMX57388.1 hypothetical protein LBK6_03055 [Leptospira borgpetersenii serovar Hardjo]AMX60619.1 hypothetical protein LBK9_03000 [Leptospira borgpetersenii serovar Hardjo]AMX63865.1 hypothetical protein LBK30_03055 [Leptospira borgpetersenii serovar Hardjo]AMX67104.1 hypothetical protein LBHA_03015 [Leptospira borgpetersenii serovar Hardjo]